MLVIIIRFRDNDDFFGNKESWVETDSELSDKVDFSFFECWEVISGSWFGYCS